MKYGIFILLLYAHSGIAQMADTIGLKACQDEAIARFPLLKQQDLLRQASQLRRENTLADYLPRLSLNGQVTYQSDVIQFPLGMPGTELPELPKERWQAYLDINQPIYSGGSRAARQSLEEQQLAIDIQQKEVNIQQLKPRVQQSYFSILLARQSEEILKTTTKLLLDKLRSVEAGVRGGVALPADALRLRSEIAKLKQQMAELSARENAAMQTLSTLTGFDITEATALRTPVINITDPEIDRPELELLTLQSRKLGAQSQLIGTDNKPKISVFAQGGLGYPNPLNFFEINTSPYYQAGVRMQWQFMDWGRTQRKQEEVSIQQQIISTEEENLERNIRIRLEKQEADISRYQQLMEQDEEIISMMEEVRQYASRQLDQGIITPTEYLDDVHEEQKARLNHSLHQIQLIQAQVAYLTEKGIY
ncbi:outer membrane protein TolC [Catalinimonas alkaloidigena]|uniref:TolC family protein n=1 Tax=Catalinimonas alkaloidigena TaxID=1075417 RepID=UPI0024058527|nr:TolC family protein [Catalinimonas alkaloidigena]MDF9798280.1 outer membrane protein TolC [Catalinimonas alkaloidigena]